MAQLRCSEVQYNRKYCSQTLAVSWTVGLLSGMKLCFCAGHSAYAWMQNILWASTSISGLFGMCFIPWFLTGFAVWIGKRELIYIISAVKTTLHGFVFFGVAATYGSSGWLVRGMTLFGDRVSMLWLYVFWQRILSVREYNGVLSIAFGMILCVVLIVLDCCIISPFLACLINM